jgi:hypothetical protein
LKLWTLEKNTVRVHFPENFGTGSIKIDALVEPDQHLPLMNPARMVNVDCSQSDDAALACALLDRLEPFWNCWQIAGDRSSVKFAVPVKSYLFELVADFSDRWGLMTDD